MTYLPYVTSPEFFATLLAAAALLVVHAWKTHGGLFAAIWLVLTGALGALTASANSYFATEPLPYWANDLISPEALLFFSVSFYLAALFAKGFVERTRFAGSPLIFALGSAITWVPFGWSWEASTRLSTALVHEVSDCGVGLVASLRIRSLGGVATDSGFVVAHGAALFLFALSYRLVSLKTQNNARKLLVLSPLTPLFALVAGYLGSRL